MCVFSKQMGEVEAVYKQKYAKFLRSRKSLCQMILTIAAGYKKHDRNVRKAKITMAAVGLGVGLPLSVATLVLFIVTAGIAVPIVGGVAAGVGVTTGVAGSGSDLTLWIIGRKIRKLVRRTIEAHIKEMEELRNSRARLSKIYEELKIEQIKLGVFGTAGVLKGVGTTIVKPLSLVDEVAVIGRIASEGLEAGGAASKAGTSMFKAAGTAGKVFQIGGFVFALVGAGVDIYTIVDSARELQKPGPELEAKLVNLVFDEMVLDDEHREELKLFCIENDISVIPEPVPETENIESIEIVESIEKN
ncbi:uncharacterized protein LOC141909558 [Tubulanus polymorphus]|uniref:uncharacterized protein LOC141909558 n=1 Tax=Tubulanus polymorphus TaxID=672921 RepID=UPI003DA65692